MKRGAACAVVANAAMLAYVMTDTTATLIASLLGSAAASVIAGWAVPRCSVLVPLLLGVVWFPVLALDDTLPALEGGAGEGLAVVFGLVAVGVAVAGVAVGAIAQLGRDSD